MGNPFYENGVWNIEEINKYTVETLTFRVNFKNTLIKCKHKLIYYGDKYYILEGTGEDKFNAPYESELKKWQEKEFMYLPYENVISENGDLLKDVYSVLDDLKIKGKTTLWFDSQVITFTYNKEPIRIMYEKRECDNGVWKNNCYWSLSIEGHERGHSCPSEKPRDKEYIKEFICGFLGIKEETKERQMSIFDFIQEV